MGDTEFEEAAWLYTKLFHEDVKERTLMLGHKKVDHSVGRWPRGAFARMEDEETLMMGGKKVDHSVGRCPRGTFAKMEVQALSTILSYMDISFFKSLYRVKTMMRPQY